MVTTCSAIGGQSAGISGINSKNQQEAAAAAAAAAATAKYVGLGCVVLVALGMVLTLYYMMVKKKGGGASSDMGTHHLVMGQSYASYANETAARFRY